MSSGLANLPRALTFRRLKLALLYVVKQPGARHAPHRTILRTIHWVLHCMAGRAATIDIGGGGGRLRLPAEFGGHGMSGVFVLRDMYEPELQYFEKTLTEGNVVVDGGANIGIYTVVGSKRVGESGLVISFEPGRLSFCRLQNNVALNSATNVHLIRAALSDRSGYASLSHGSAGPVTYALRPTGIMSGGSESVPTTTLDAALAARQVKQIDILKLDIEGAEELALRGAAGVFTEPRAMPVIIFEMRPSGPVNLGLRSDGAWQFLRQHGYRLHRVGVDGRLVEQDVPQVGNNVALPARQVRF